MKLIRKAIKEPKSLFTKIVIGIVLLSFTFFGVSEVIVGNSDSWVAKIGGQKISRTFFEKNLEMDRAIIKSSQPNNEKVTQYVASENFKSDALSRIIRKNIIGQVSDEIGVFANEKLILEAVAKDPSFHDEKGKFVHQKFKDFLAKNGFDESRYVKEVSSEIAAEMILQSMAMAAPANFQAISEVENFNQEQRVADIIQITKNDIKFQSKISDSDAEKFFNENKANYRIAETRKVDYFEFNESFFNGQNVAVSDEEAKAEFEKNKDKFISKETRDFYHLPFANKEKAEEFIKNLNAIQAGSSRLKTEFLTLAQKNTKKTAKEIIFNKVAKTDLPEAIANEVFALKKDELSKIVESPIGFHVFLINEIKPEKPILFSEAKDEIKAELLNNKKEQLVQKKINEVNDALVSSEKLAQVAEKFAIKFDPKPVIIDVSGNDLEGQKISQISHLKDFTKFAFDLKQGQISKLIPSTGKYYVVQVLEINPAHQREFAEVKTIVAKDAEEKAKMEGVAMLAKSVQEELQKTPSAFAAIAAKHHLKVEKNRSFPRSFVLNLGGEAMPYKNKFLQELFSKKIGEVTSASASDQGGYMIAALRSIKKANLAYEDLAKVKKVAVDAFISDVMREYNKYLQTQFPVEINKTLFKNGESQSQN